MEILNHDLLFLAVERAGEPAAVVARLSQVCPKLRRICKVHLWSKCAQGVVAASGVSDSAASDLLACFHGREDELVKLIKWCPGLQTCCWKTLGLQDWVVFSKYKETRKDEHAEPGHTVCEGDGKQIAFDVVESLFSGINKGNRGLSFTSTAPCNEHTARFRFFVHRGWLMPAALEVVRKSFSKKPKKGTACPFCQANVWNAVKSLNPAMQRSLTDCPMKNVSFFVCSKGHFFGLHYRRKAREDFSVSDDYCVEDYDYNQYGRDYDYDSDDPYFSD